MPYDARKSLNMANYIRNMDPAFDQYAQEPDSGFDAELDRFVVPDWSADSFGANAVGSNAQETQQPYHAFELADPLYADQSDFLGPNVFLDPALQDTQSFDPTAVEDTTTQLPTDFAFLPELNFAQAPTTQAEPLPEQGSEAPEQSGTPKAGPSPDTQERARKAADEDKRRRNTAASSKFRHKKKVQEKEMLKKIQSMEALIEDLRKQLQRVQVEKKALQDVLALKNGDTTAAVPGERVKPERETSEIAELKRRRIDV